MERIHHPWTKWECYQAGFYHSSVPEQTERCKELYREFLANSHRFHEAMGRVSQEWVYSCGHFLSNENTNRVAWLGQSAMCIETGTSSVYRGGFYLLSQSQQKEANDVAERFLIEWIDSRTGKWLSTFGVGKRKDMTKTFLMKFLMFS